MKRHLAAIALLALTAGRAEADLVIDDFGVGLQNVSTASGTASDAANGLPTSSVLGGTRDLEVTVTNSPVGGSATAAVNPAFGIFSLSNDALLSSTALLGYNSGGAGFSPTIDLTAFGSQFELDILAVDLTLSLSINVITTGGSQAISRTGLAAGILNIGFGEYNAVDLTKVTGIELLLTAPDSADFTAGYFGVTGTVAATPEPSSIALGLSGLGVVGFAAARCRVSARASGRG